MQEINGNILNNFNGLNFFDRSNFSRINFSWLGKKFFENIIREKYSGILLAKKKSFKKKKIFPKNQIPENKTEKSVSIPHL